MKQGCGRRERGVRRERVLFCILYSVFCILFFTGCAVKQKVSSSDPQLDSLQIFSRVRELKPINTFKGVGSLEIISGGLLHTSRVVIAAKSPHSFRIEFLNPLNQPSAVIVNNGQGYQFYYSGKIYKGTALPGYFPLQDLKYIPLYIIGWSDIPHEKIDGIRDDEDLDAVIIRLLYYDEGAYHKVWFNPKEYTIIRREVYNRDNNSIVTIFFDDYIEINGTRFPMFVDVKTDRMHLNIRYTKVEVNGNVDDELFSLSEIQE